MIARSAIPTDRLLRTMVVDDHVDTATALTALIEEWGWNARRAHDGETALQIFDEFRPVVVLLDLKLPGESGYEIAMRLRERAWRRRLYIVIVTGHVDVADQAQSTRAGISHHLIKPVNPDALRRILSAYQFAEEVVGRPPEPGEETPGPG
jgi:DNA-binding response OmpR family regulator